MLLIGAEVAGHGVGANQRPSPPIPSPREPAGRGESTTLSRVRQTLLGLINRKTILYFATAFLLFAVDVGCTYTTFAVRGVPIEFEVNQVFRDWVIRDGWLLSIGKFTILKTLLFAVAGWAIFRTRSRIAAFVLAQCIVSNHLVAISSHPTLWWMDNLEYRSLLLKGVAGVSMVLTFYGIRFLRSKPPVSGSAAGFSQDLPVCPQN